MKTNHPSYSAIKTFRVAAAGVGVLMIANAVYQELTKFKVENKVVLITGGSRGLGLVLARELAARGAKLALCARSADKLELARQDLEALGAEVITLPVDLTDQAQVKTMIHDVVRHYGRLDVLVNNAGMIQVGPEENMQIADYEKAMQVNFFAPLYAIKQVVPIFKRQGEGRIVNITSIGGKIAIPHLLPYTASKFAAVGLSEGLHAELKKENIHVTTIVPNLMRTGSPRNVTVKGDHEAEYAWFKTADSSPILSQEAETVAKKIISALEQGKAETVLSLSGKFASIVKGIAPGWVSILLSVANNFLPKAKPYDYSEKLGFESESSYSQGPVNSLTNCL
jgi:short-subunit dehydrogenase